MKILKFLAENVKRLTAVEITPTGDTVVLAGENEQGKSSVLDAIEMALGGKDHIPSRPVREGAKAGKVRLDLGDYVVTRTFTPGGGGSLTVTNRDGAKYPSPQGILDGLVGRLSFDPLDFARMKPAEQATTLRALAKVDTTEIELARKAAFDQRTLTNRDLSQASGALATMPRHDGVGTEPETFDALTAQLDAADQLAKSAADADQAFALSGARQKNAADAARKAGERVEALRAQLEDAEQALEAAQMGEATAFDAKVGADTAQQEARAAVPDRAALRAQIATITDRNAMVAENRARVRMETKATDYRANADALTATIERLDGMKAAALAGATFPIAGLGLDDNGVTWQGLPFDQASTAVRTRVACAIGMALNRSLQVMLIRGGNDLDAKSLGIVAEMAAERGCQVWIERIAGGAAGQQTIVIEDGGVAL